MEPVTGAFPGLGVPHPRLPSCAGRGAQPRSPLTPPGRLFLYSASLKGPVSGLFLALLSDTLWTTSPLVPPHPARCDPCSPGVPGAAPPVPAGLRAGRRQRSPHPVPSTPRAHVHTGRLVQARGEPVGSLPFPGRGLGAINIVGPQCRPFIGRQGGSLQNAPLLLLPAFTQLAWPSAGPGVCGVSMCLRGPCRSPARCCPPRWLGAVPIPARL